MMSQIRPRTSPASTEIVAPPPLSGGPSPPSNEETDGAATTTTPTPTTNTSSTTSPTTTPPKRRMIDASGIIHPSSHSSKKKKEAQDVEAQENHGTMILEEPLPAQPAEPTTRVVTEPGAVPVRSIAATQSSKDDHRHNNENNHNNADISPPEERDHENTSPPLLVARVARDDEDDIRAMYQQQLATEVERMRQELVLDATIVVADEVKPPNDDDIPTHRHRCRRRRCIVGLLILVVLGAALGGVLYWVLQDNQTQKGLQPQQQLDPLVEDLRSLIAPTDEDLVPFSDPESPQSKALAWLQEDPITLTPDRTTETLLERYVLAVFNSSTSGWPSPFLSSEPVCRWNAVSCTNGVVTALDLYSASIFDIGGTLPWELVLLTNLITLDLSFSQLTGVIPTRINELTNLDILWMENDLLSGLLPHDLPESLIGLYLHGNAFTGTLPDVWGTRLALLKEFLIYENQLTGTIPSSIGQISSLIRFEFGTNNFTGSVDSCRVGSSDGARKHGARSE